MRDYAFERTRTAESLGDTSFDYTHILFISPHHYNTSEIKIWDITDSVSSPLGSEDFKEETEYFGQAHSDETPTWIIHNPGLSKDKALHPGRVTYPTEDTIITTWRPSTWSAGKNAFDFPPNSPHCSHGLVMERPRWYKNRAETFVQDSMEYSWRWEGHSGRKFTLWKGYGDRKIPVAQYKSPLRLAVMGGTVVVNADEVDVVVALITCVANLLKNKQAK
jgi:hypothetical protein